MGKKIRQYRLFRILFMLCICLAALDGGTLAVKAADWHTERLTAAQGPDSNAVLQTAEQDDGSAVLQNGGLLEASHDNEYLFFSGAQSGHEAVSAAVMTAWTILKRPLIYPLMNWEKRKSFR